MPNNLMENLKKLLDQTPMSDIESSEDEEEYLEYIYRPRKYFLVGLCNVSTPSPSQKKSLLNWRIIIHMYVHTYINHLLNYVLCSFVNVIYVKRRSWLNVQNAIWLIIVASIMLKMMWNIENYVLHCNKLQLRNPVSLLVSKHSNIHLHIDTQNSLKLSIYWRWERLWYACIYTDIGM